MKKSIFYITLILLNVVTYNQVFSQRVDLDRFYFDVQYQKLPQLFVREGDRTVGIRTRIGQSIKDFTSKKNHNRKNAFRLLSARINYITSNTKLRNNKDKVFVGIHYSNPFLNSDVSLEKLQKRLKWHIDRAGLTNAEKQIMLKFT